MQHELRFDYNGHSHSFSKTAQGFLRIQARLSKTGIFDYQNQREYRAPEEVFHADSLASLRGAPVTDLHPNDELITPDNAKEHIIGITESVERDGDYLKGSLIIFHKDAIKAIENGDRKEISLGYKCLVEPSQGQIDGQTYDAVQKNITINHVAIGPKGWGRAGPDCAIKTDSNLEKELLELKQKLKAFEDPKFIEQKVAEKMRLDAVKKLYPDLDLAKKDQSYIDGLYDASQNKELKNDSLTQTRIALTERSNASKNSYDNWLKQTSQLWQKPLSGHL